LTLILSGAVGNMIDRVMNGFVVDLMIIRIYAKVSHNKFSGNFSSLWNIKLRRLLFFPISNNQHNHANADKNIGKIENWPIKVLVMKINKIYYEFC
jgi:hypothetical protein